MACDDDEFFHDAIQFLEIFDFLHLDDLCSSYVTLTMVLVLPLLGIRVILFVQCINQQEIFAQVGWLVVPRLKGQEELIGDSN
jgi:hypothetical protein